MIKWDKFHQQFFGKSEVKWFGTKGILKVNDEVNAEIIVDDLKIHDHFRQYLVRIVHKQSGQLSANGFVFDNYLSVQPGSRDNEFFEVIGHCSRGDADWYIKQPTEKSMKAMAKTIFEYIEMWK